jgi:plasmid stabilization system protein ParE
VAPRRALLFRPKAAEDLRRIHLFIAEDNAERALTFIDAIEKRCLSLLDFPEQGRARDDLRQGARLPYGKSVVIPMKSPRQR